MNDQHLNLFYTYNHDKELIENNLTRALIVTLRFLTPQTRQALLSGVLSTSNPRPDSLYSLTLPNFDSAEFRLQAHMDAKKSRQFQRKYILTIASYRGYSLDDGAENQTTDDAFPAETASIPDAWIFDMAQDYCFLIEAKIGSNPLSNPQIIAHANDWFHISRASLTQHLIGISWYDLVDSIHSVLAESNGCQAANGQEKYILSAFEEYLGFFGYRVFLGFGMNGLQDAAGIRFQTDSNQDDTWYLDFSQLSESPAIRLQHSQSRTTQELDWFLDFTTLEPPPALVLS